MSNVFYKFQSKFFSSSQASIKDLASLSLSTSLATVPSGFPTQSINDFTIFINGVAVEKEAVTSVAQSGPNVVITFNATQLGYTISASDEYMITGKLEA